MRPIGTLSSQKQAQTFADYLLSRGIVSQVDPAGEEWEIWIHDDSDLPTAAQILLEFRQSPEDARFTGAHDTARRIRAKKESEQREYEKRYFNRRRLFPRMTPYGVGPLTFAIICLLLVFWAAFKVESAIPLLQRMMISDLALPAGNLLDRLAGLIEVREGEIWRLLTPAFLHVQLIHLLSNVLMLFPLGSMFEARKGTSYLLLLVMPVGIFSNVGQYLMVGPNFLGFSGVNYGLFGFIWMAAKFNPRSGLFVQKETVVLLVAWYFLCLFNIIPGIANTAHTVGLVMGMIWGFIDAKISENRYDD